MNEEQLDDLKQFVATTVAQTEKRLQGEIGQLRAEMADGFAGVGEAIEEIHSEFERYQTKTNKRLIKLEHKTA